MGSIGFLLLREGIGSFFLHPENTSLQVRISFIKA